MRSIIIKFNYCRHRNTLSVEKSNLTLSEVMLASSCRIPSKVGLSGSKRNIDTRR